MATTAFIENETEFDSLIAAEPLLVVDCTAPWCGPCKIVAPLMDQLGDEFADSAKVYKLDIDANQDLVKRFGIRSIPAVMIFKNGELVETVVGAKPYEHFQAAVNNWL